MSTQAQDDFLTCYRGRQSILHHASYMRMSKVLLALHLCEMAKINLKRANILDYGFGAGTFFRYCPSSSHLFGVEMDPTTVNDVQMMLQHRGYTHVDLRTIDLDHWVQHPLLTSQYDVILCSHVLEHMTDPVSFLNIIRNCLSKNGVFIGLVPINEWKPDPHHLQVVDKATIHNWADRSGLLVHTYLEADPWFDWCRLAPDLFTDRVLQALHVGLGIPATLLGYRCWACLSQLYTTITASRPAQAGFVLTL